MNFANVLKLRIPSTLRDRLDDAARVSARSRSDVAREGLAIGLETLVRRVPGSDDNPPQAA
jgi:predicted transcriptional regulator